MDSDDISLPFRFEKQVQLFAKSDVDVVGGWISEFSGNRRGLSSSSKGSD